MPAATNRADLLAVTAAEYVRLTDLIADLPPEVALRKRDDDTSIKDVIGHRAHWIELFLGWEAEGRAGGQPEIPGPGYKWSDLKAFNAQLRKAQARLGWSEVRDMLSINHGRLVAFIEGSDEARLYGGPMPGGGSKWPTGRWAEAAGASHYRSAGKWIRACLRAEKAS